jgi:hypothetical protein
MSFLVYQVGCIECQVSSYAIKVTETLKEAVDVAEKHPSTWDTEGGEGFLVIIDLQQCKTVFKLAYK